MEMTVAGMLEESRVICEECAEERVAQDIAADRERQGSAVPFGV